MCARTSERVVSSAGLSCARSASTTSVTHLRTWLSPSSTRAWRNEEMWWRQLKAALLM